MAHGAAPRTTTPCCANQATSDATRRKRDRVTGAEVQPIDVVSDLLCHGTDITTKDRLTKAKCLLNDERRIFPPNRRDDYPINVGHEPRQLGVLIGPYERYIIPGALQQRPKLLLIVALLEIEVRTVDP